MTFTEATEAMKKGRKVRHSRHNPGWYIVADGKGFAAVHEAQRFRQAYRMDKNDMSRTDWVEFKQ